jgi:hypothetical protein
MKTALAQEFRHSLASLAINASRGIIVLEKKKPGNLYARITTSPVATPRL